MLRGLPHLCKYMPEFKEGRKLLPDPRNEPDFDTISSLWPVPEVAAPVGGLTTADTLDTVRLAALAGFLPSATNSGTPQQRAVLAQLLSSLASEQVQAKAPPERDLASLLQAQLAAAPLGRNSVLGSAATLIGAQQWLQKTPAAIGRENIIASLVRGRLDEPAATEMPSVACESDVAWMIRARMENPSTRAPQHESQVSSLLRAQSAAAPQSSNNTATLKSLIDAGVLSPGGAGISLDTIAVLLRAQSNGR